MSTISYSTIMIMKLDPVVERVLEAIRAVGGRPMLDGGFVRDSLMGLTGSKDVDMEVYGISDPGILFDALDKIGHVMVAGKAYSVLKLRAKGMDIDVSLPRRERRTGPGHRDFEVIPDGMMGFREATARRDFTINSILYDPATGEYIDCHGGMRDLRDGILRATSKRFKEDPLRVLRGMQFAARFNFTMDPYTVELCRSLMPEYASLPKERVWVEWEKLGTLGVKPSQAMSTLGYTGWEKLYPELFFLHMTPQDREWHPEGDVWVHSCMAADEAAKIADEAGLAGTDRLVIVFAALCHDMGKVTNTQIASDGRITSRGHAEAGVEPATKFLNRIGCPHETRRRIVTLVREHMSTLNRPTRASVRRLARRLQPATMTELHVVVNADRNGRGRPYRDNSADAWFDMAKDLSVEEKPRAGILTGKHLIAYGMKPGPGFKDVLSRALEAQDNGEFETESDAIAWMIRNYSDDMES